MAGMIGLTNYQLKIVMNAARSIPVEKPCLFALQMSAFDPKRTSTVTAL
jgi:hypothetical protein